MKRRNFIRGALAAIALPATLCAGKTLHPQYELLSKVVSDGTEISDGQIYAKFRLEGPIRVRVSGLEEIGIKDGSILEKNDMDDELRVIGLGQDSPGVPVSMFLKQG